MANATIVIFGTKSGKLRATIRRPNYPQTEVTIGTGAFMALPEALRDQVRGKCLDYLTGLQEHYTANLGGLILP